MVGRKREQLELDRLCETRRSEFAVVYGRRRVGKTFLVREYFGNEFAFYATGAAGGAARVQMASFNKSLREYGAPGGAKDWFEAFDQLEGILCSPDVHREEFGHKRVVFIDEMPWLDSPRTDFRVALELFWNRWGSAQKDVLLIACGSATSWIIKNLLEDRGGLHNRVTARIHLDPFTLRECEEYYRANGLELSRIQMIESYMIFGGIPYYLDLMHRRLGLVQNVDRLCFARHGALRDEFDELYRSLFRHPERHMSIVRALSTRLAGLSRDQIVGATGLPNGGSLTTTLEELEQCDFIRSYTDYPRATNGRLYQLIDPFTLFYLRFMEDASDERFWSERYLGGQANAWQGYAFELVCLLHVEQIRAALGVAGVSHAVSSWRSKSSDPGAQIDLVLDRADGVINLCEMKFAREPYAVTKAYDATLMHKLSSFANETRSRKALHLTLVSPCGAARNAYANDLQAVIDADGLFG